MKRLVCVVEGHGDVNAVPHLCARIMRHLEIGGWIVDQEPVRRPRSLLVDERTSSPLRGCREDGLQVAVELAVRRPADAVLILCDSDDDCPATWGPSAAALVGERVRGGAVMAVREYEAWLLHSRSDAELDRARIRAVDEIRDVKKALRRIVKGYSPRLYQRDLTRQLDVERVRRRSPSFEKFVRELERLCEGAA